MNNKKVRKLLSHGLKGFGYVALTHGGRIHHLLWQYSPLVPFMRSIMIRIRERERENFSRSKGCKGILKKQSCPGCNAPIGFIDALTFLRSVRRRHLLDFFFITKIGEFQGEQDSSICFNHSCVSISSLAACNFSFMRGHCSVQIGSSFLQVTLIIVLFVK